MTIIIDEKFMAGLLIMIMIYYLIVIVAQHIIFPIIGWILNNIEATYKKLRKPYNTKIFLKKKYPNGFNCIWCGTNNKMEKEKQRCSKCEALL